jgi:erythromycin esterase-like protein
LLRTTKPDAKLVVWAHNAHVGDGTATEMGNRGEVNVGALCRRAYGNELYVVGFGTDGGTVAAADEWGGPMRIMEVGAAHARSYERVCRDTGVASFLLPLREARLGHVRAELDTPRLERAIGVLYRPAAELTSHYFEARLPRQFDEYVWLARTSAVTPLPARAATTDEPDTYPFGL